MNADLLLKHYGRIADAPDAITRLRRFILDLAVRGKLVPQDSKDEPASELLTRIAAEKKGVLGRRLEYAGIRFDDTDQLPFSVPSGWRWVNLEQIVTKLTDGTHHSPPNGPSGEFKYITAKNIKSEGISLNDVTYVSRSVHHEIYARCNPEKGDILYIKDGATTGIVTINDLDEPFSMLSSVALLKLPSGILNRLLVAFLRSPFFYDQMRGFMKGMAITRVTLKRMAPALLPLPPLAEQHRIVAKVDELMALCDQLEAARANRETTRDQLAAASLARLNTPDPDTFHDDARIVLDALPALTTRPDQIKQLRQTILNLAVRGKLVPQYPRDEPANLSISACDDAPPDIPAGWRYTQLVNVLSEDTRNGYSRKPDDAPDGTPILRISAGTTRRDGLVAEEEHKRISGIDSDVRLQYGLKQGDLLACRFNGNKTFVGRLTIFTDYLRIRPIYPDKLIRVRLSTRLAVPAFIRLAGDSDLVRREVEAACATTVGNWGISASSLKEIRFPLPSLAEQHRIVAKVDELMALCDRLEASLTIAGDTRRRLLDALLHEALAPVDREAAHKRTSKQAVGPAA